MKNYTTKIARAKENADKAQKNYDEACKRRNDAGIALDKDAYEAANVQVQIAHDEWQNALREYDNVVKAEVANYCEDDNNDTEDNAEAMANIEIKIAKNGSKRYYVRDDNGKLSQISRQKAYELQTEADNKVMANIFEQVAEKEMTDIEQANYIAHVDIETPNKPTVYIKYAINLGTAAEFIRLCDNTFGKRLIGAHIRDTKGSTVNTEEATEEKSERTEKKLYKVFKANHDDEVPQETATKLDIIIDEKKINVSMNVNRKNLTSAYNVFTKALDQAVADGVISVKTAQFGNFADDINDIDFGGKDYYEAHDSLDNAFAYGIDDNTCTDSRFYFWFWATTDNAEGENNETATETAEVITTENKPTRRELEIEKKIIMDEIDEAREGLIDAEADTEIPQSHIDYLKDIIDTRIKDYYEVCAKLDELNDDLPPENKPDAERETANVESTTAADTTPEYKYYIKSRRPIFGAAPNGYIKAVSGEVHEPVRRPNGTYSPKCRIYFATVIYDKPLTDEQIINYDLAVSNETFELLNAATAEGENANTDDNEVNPLENKYFRMYHPDACANEEIINCTDDIIITDDAYTQMIHTEFANAQIASGNYGIQINGEWVYFSNHKITRIDAERKLGFTFEYTLQGRKQFRHNGRVVNRDSVIKFFENKDIAAAQEKSFREFFINRNAPHHGFFQVQISPTFADGEEHNYGRAFEYYDDAINFVNNAIDFCGDVPTHITIKRDKQAGQIYYHRTPDGSVHLDKPDTDFFKYYSAEEIQARIDAINKAIHFNRDFYKNIDSDIDTEGLIAEANFNLEVTRNFYEFVLRANAPANTDAEVCTAIEKSDAKETYKRVNKVLSIGLKYVTTKQGRHMWYCNGTLINKSLASAVLAAHGFTPEEFIAAKKVADEYFLEIEIPRRYAIRKQAKHLWGKIDRDCKPSAEPMPALFPAEDSDNDDEPPPTDKVITPDEMLAIVDTLDTVNASAPAGWQIDYNGKNFPVKFNDKTVANLDSLALTKILPPDKFFDRFKPDVPPKEQYINERRKELDMLLDFRKFVEDDPDRLKTLANLIEDVKREILDSELDTEHPPDCTE